MDTAASALADLCQLAERHTDQLFQGPGTAPLLSSDEWSVKPLHHAQNWWAEEARALASSTVLSLAGFGQNDVPAMSFLAYRKAMAVGRCLDAALAALAALAAQALYVAGRGAGPRLDALVSQVRVHFPPVTGEVRRLGLDCDALSAAFSAEALGEAAG